MPSAKTEAAIYWSLVFIYLLPVWLFRYLPTQDGPAHLATAVILKEHGRAHTRYHEFFELRLEPFPNWTTHLLLAGLLHLFPPLVAEKVLVSLYVVGFSWSLRYFLGAFGDGTRQLASVGLLFLFNRCFLMGFYNYCLSLILLWVVLGYCLRRRGRFGVGDMAVLILFWWPAYFTHLLGYALAAAGALWVAITMPPHRVRRVLYTAGSLLPTAWLAVASLTRPRLLGLREAVSEGNGLDTLWRQVNLNDAWLALDSVNQHLFEPYEGWYLPMDILVLLVYGTLLLSTLLLPPATPGNGDEGPNRLPIALFGLFAAGLYLVLPDFLSLAVGFLKARLVLLPPLLWLACLRVPRQRTARRLVNSLVCLLVVLNVVLVTRHFQVANRDLAEFTAGEDQVGRDRVLFVAPSARHPSRRLVDHLEHAADYYCLTTGNVNLDNFQATLQHFPVRFRPGVRRGRGDVTHYPNRDVVDVVLVWDPSPGFPLPPAASWRQVYQRGRLTLFAKRE